MTDKILLDTNIIVYAYVATDFTKWEKAKSFINGLKNEEVCISTQVLSETYSALKKNSVNDTDAKYYLEYCMKKYNILTIEVEDIRMCLTLRGKYSYSYWDCLILATAINNGCSVVYSEDMQNKHMLYAGVKIVNPLI